MNVHSIGHVQVLWKRNMKECISWQGFSVSLNQFLRFISEPFNGIWINTAPTIDSFAVVRHGVEGPEIEQFVLASLIKHWIDIVTRSMNAARTLFGHTNIESHIKAGNCISTDVSLGIVVSLDVHIWQLLVN